MTQVRSGTEVIYKYKNGKQVIELDIYNATQTINEFLCSVQEDKILHAGQIKMLIRYNATIGDFTNHFFTLIGEMLEKQN